MFSCVLEVRGFLALPQGPLAKTSSPFQKQCVFAFVLGSQCLLPLPSLLGLLFDGGQMPSEADWDISGACSPAAADHSAHSCPTHLDSL